MKIELLKSELRNAPVLAGLGLFALWLSACGENAQKQNTTANSFARSWAIEGQTYESVEKAKEAQLSEAERGAIESIMNLRGSAEVDDAGVTQGSSWNKNSFKSFGRFVKGLAKDAADKNTYGNKFSRFEELRENRVYSYFYSQQAREERKRYFETLKEYQAESADRTKDSLLPRDILIHPDASRAGYSGPYFDFEELMNEKLLSAEWSQMSKFDGTANSRGKGSASLEKSNIRRDDRQIRDRGRFAVSLNGDLNFENCHSVPDYDEKAYQEAAPWHLDGRDVKSDIYWTANAIENLESSLIQTEEDLKELQWIAKEKRGELEKLLIEISEEHRNENRIDPLQVPGELLSENKYQVIHDLLDPYKTKVVDNSRVYDEKVLQAQFLLRELIRQLGELEDETDERAFLEELIAKKGPPPGESWPYTIRGLESRIRKLLKRHASIITNFKDQMIYLLDHYDAGTYRLHGNLNMKMELRIEAEDDPRTRLNYFELDGEDFQEDLRDSLEGVSGMIQFEMVYNGDTDARGYNSKASKDPGFKDFRLNFRQFGLAFRISVEDYRELIVLGLDPLMKKSDREKQMREILNRSVFCSGEVALNKRKLGCKEVAQHYIEEMVKEGSIFGKDDQAETENESDPITDPNETSEQPNE